MNRLAFCTLIFSFNLLNAQTPVSDSVSLGGGYASMSFYSLAVGETANVNAKDWDLQIWNNLMSSSIRVNDGAGVMLYRLQNDDTTNWMAIDTTGMTPLYNSDTTWEIGAFSALAGVHPDYGWGIYTGGGNLTGYRIFVIKTISGNYKKIWIKRLVYDGTNAYYEIAVGNLDNTGEQLVTIAKTAYPTKEFIYYAIDSAAVKDIEPAKTDWDLVLRRYQSYITLPPQPAQYYTVMGVLSHPAVTVAEARGVDVSINDYSAYPFEENISVIGSDWKNFNQGTFQWELIDSLAYFVSAQDGYIYKLVFTGFGGQGTGKVFFNKTQLEQASTAVADASIRALTVYPNPASDQVQALFVLRQESDMTIRILDLSGKIHFDSRLKARSGLNAFTLNTADFAQGFYLLSVNDGASQLTFKLVKNE
ncbi:MAG TPA: T9SS type A sorting domain-containing protein [Chitinophagales bacterium]|nr:T9SS type A sorting domain-containing protein [Chitinophagales bacterium]